MRTWKHRHLHDFGVHVETLAKVQEAAVLESLRRWLLPQSLQAELYLDAHQILYWLSSGGASKGLVSVTATCIHASTVCWLIALGGCVDVGGLYLGQLSRTCTPASQYLMSARSWYCVLGSVIARKAMLRGRLVDFEVRTTRSLLTWST